jgi:hypothetical protein
MANVRSTCPLGVRNALVTFDDTADGARVTFTAGPESLDELRARAMHTAQMHGPGKELGEGHNGKHGTGGSWHGINPTWLPPATASFEPTSDGARITYTPVRAQDLSLLRERLKMRADSLMTRCPDDP